MNMVVAPLLLAVVVGCSGQEPAPSDPGVDEPWLPFEQGEQTAGTNGVARFQIAPCAYPRMVDVMPTCALDMSLILLVVFRLRRQRQLPEHRAVHPIQHCRAQVSADARTEQHHPLRNIVRRDDMDRARHTRHHGRVRSAVHEGRGRRRRRRHGQRFVSHDRQRESDHDHDALQNGISRRRLRRRHDPHSVSAGRKTNCCSGMRTPA